MRPDPCAVPRIAPEGVGTRICPANLLEVSRPHLSMRREPLLDLGVMLNLLSRRSVTRVFGSPVFKALSAEEGPERSMASASCCITDPGRSLPHILRSLARTINCLFASLKVFAGLGVPQAGRETIPHGGPAG